MNQSIDKLLRILFGQYTIDSFKENDKWLECEMTVESIQAPRLHEVESALTFLPTRDKLNITVESGTHDPISFYSVSNNLSSFIGNLEKESKFGTEKVKATFIIDKSRVDNTISIYNLTWFTKTLKNLNISEFFSVLGRAISDLEYVIFSVDGLSQTFSSDTIYFLPSNSVQPAIKSSGRLKRLDAIKNISYFAQSEDLKLIPNDLKINQTPENKDLYDLMNNYGSALAVIYLFDITSLNENILDFKINGYKSLKGQVNLSESNETYEEYFKIYDWVYTGGNLIDKMGLARNILSLHFLKAGELSLQGSPYQSIQSSYKLYEKQNIKQYIEVRNKISDQLLDFNSRANKVIETFASGFQKSALALISFYISAIVLKVLGKGDFQNLFTLDATILSVAFIFGSLIYYEVSKWEVNIQKKRFQESYRNLKERYTDLLERGDIEIILNNDQEFDADVDFIDAKLKNYSRLWMGVLFILFLTTLILFCKSNILTFHGTPPNNSPDVYATSKILFLSIALVLAILIYLTLSFFAKPKKVWARVTLSITVSIALTLAIKMVPKVNIIIKPSQSLATENNCCCLTLIESTDKEMHFIGKIGPFITGTILLDKEQNMNFKNLKDSLSKNNYVEILICGGVDKRPLHGNSEKVFGDNLSLAQARARMVKDSLTNYLANLNKKATPLTFVNGGEFYGKDSDSLSKDRCVKIYGRRK